MDQTAETRALVPESASQSRAISPLDPTQVEQDVWSSLDQSTEEGRRKLMSTQLDDATPIADVLNTEVTIQDITCHRASKTNPETGEVSEYTRTLLHCAGGEMIATGAKGITQSIGILTLQYGRPPWRPGLKCKIVSRPTSTGGHVYKLRPVLDDAQVVVEKKKK